MVDQTTGPAGRTTDVGADISDAGRRLEDERRVLSQTMGEAKDAVAAQARDLKDQATGQLGAQAESMKEEATAGLTAFSDALKAASSELSGKQLGFAGDMVQQAAGGLESFVRAVESRSPGEMLDGLRSFGRQNPVGFIAGSVLAGFALGRLAAVLPPEAGSTTSPASTSPATTSRGATFPANGGPAQAGTMPAGGSDYASWASEQVEGAGR